MSEIKTPRTRTKPLTSHPPAVTRPMMPIVADAPDREIVDPPTENRVPTRELPPLAKPHARMTLELADVSDLAEFVEHLARVLRTSQKKRITITIEESDE